MIKNRSGYPPDRQLIAKPCKAVSKQLKKVFNSQPADRALKNKKQKRWRRLVDNKHPPITPKPGIRKFRLHTSYDVKGFTSNKISESYENKYSTHPVRKLDAFL